MPTTLAAPKAATPFKIIKDHTDIPPGFAISIDGLISAAFSAAQTLNINPVPGGVETGFKLRRFESDASSGREGFVDEYFMAALLGDNNRLDVYWLNAQAERVLVLSKLLRPLCEMRMDSRSVLQCQGWLKRAYRSPDGTTALDWACTEFKGAAIWYVAKGWLRFTGAETPNSLGGIWPMGEITDAGRAYLAGLAPVQLYADATGQVIAAFDGFSTWRQFEAGRWVHNDDSRATAKTELSTYRLAGTVPFTEFGFAQIG